MLGAFVGRFSPIHRGHVVMINEMFDKCEKSLIIIGSCTEPMSMRHFFSYRQRRGFIKEIFPGTPIVGIPDYRSDEDWLLALDDIISSSMSIRVLKSKIDVVFFGGCEEDLQVFIKNNRKFHILNRYDDTTPKVSSSEVRDCILHNRSLEGKVSPCLISPVTTTFKTNWELFVKK